MVATGALIAAVAGGIAFLAGAFRSPAGADDLARLVLPAPAIASGYADLPLAGGAGGAAGDGRDEPDSRTIVRRSGAPGKPTVVQQIDRAAPVQLAAVAARTLLNTSRAGAIAEAVELTGETPCRGAAAAGVFRYDEPEASGAAIVCLRGQLAVRVDVTTRDSRGRPVSADYADLLALAVAVSNRVLDRVGP
jgi:hypothetical protein